MRSVYGDKPSWKKRGGILITFLCVQQAPMKRFTYFLLVAILVAEEAVCSHFLADRIEFFQIQQMGSDSVKISFPSARMIETKRPCLCLQGLVHPLFSGPFKGAEH